MKNSNSKSSNAKRYNSLSGNQKRLFDNWVNTVETNTTLSGNGNNRSRSRGRNKKSAPVSTAYRTVTKAPTQKRGTRSHRITHREQLAIVNGSTTFIASEFKVNPGLSSSFPWLSTQAAGWDQYRFHSVSFEFVPTCASTKTGTVMMATDYDANDPPPSNETALMSYEGASSDSSWAANWSKLDQKAMFPAGPRKYIRDSLVSGTDIKTYDVGNFFFAVDGQDNTDKIGRLFVCYDVEFFVPTTKPSEPCPHILTLLRVKNAVALTGSSVLNFINYDTKIVDAIKVVPGSLVGGWVFPKGCFLVQLFLNVIPSTAIGNSVTYSLRKRTLGGIDSISHQVTASPLPASTTTNGGILSLNQYVSSNGTDEFFVVLEFPEANTITLGSNQGDMVILSV